MVFLLNFVWQQLTMNSVNELNDTEFITNTTLILLASLDEITSMGNKISEKDWKKMEDEFEQRIDNSGLIKQYMEMCNTQAPKEMN